MVRINLLPAGMLRERGKQRAQARFLLVAMMIVVLLVACYGLLFVNTLGVKGKLVVVGAERIAVEGEIALYSVYTAMQSEVNNKSSLLKNAMGLPLPFVEILEEVGMVIPPNVWLTDLVLSHPPVDNGGSTVSGQMVLRGLTYDHPSTALWITAMREVVGVNDVWAVFSTEEKVEDVMLVRFEIRAELLPDSKYEPLSGRGE